VDGGSSSSRRKRHIDDLSTASISTSERWVEKLQVTEDSSSHKQINLHSCESIIVNPRKENISRNLIYFHKYGALYDTASYCFQNLGVYLQLYSRMCNKNEGKMRSKKTDKDEKQED
jgi:hypothetical protein